MADEQPAGLDLIARGIGLRLGSLAITGWLLAFGAGTLPEARAQAAPAGAVQTAAAQPIAAAADGRPAEAPGKPGLRPSTAGPRVSIVTPPFGLGPTSGPRWLRIYLPPSYALGDRRYPVIYMHDAQNLFDEASAFAGEWGVDETLDELARREGFEAIVVGIDHGGAQRVTEMNPWDHPRFGRGEGLAYTAFIVHTLKPWIDAQYRTLAAPEQTALIGSSLSALITERVIRLHPQSFGRAGILSPAYWVADPAIFDFARQHPLPAGSRVYLSVGEREGEGTVQRAERMLATLRNQRPEPGAIHWHRVAGAEHNETAWRQELPRVIRALFGLGVVERGPR
ncbi:MAG: alpha/beta hydrolase [Rubrivivax sp.]|nr:alpha/beta hydrolase [Rubrivivax sp.]